MKSLNQALKSVVKNKKGVLGFQTVADAAIEFFILALIVVAIIIGAYVLSTSSVVPIGTLAYNNTQSILNNVSSAPATFFGYSTTIFQLLAVAVILLALGIVIFAVYQFRGRAQSGVSA